MLPSIFGENLFEDMWDDFFEPMPPFEHRMPPHGKHGKNLMKTDVRETEDSYELDIDLPGFKKEDVKVDLKNGYLTISAAKNLEKENKKKDARYIRRERYCGQMARSFYVGEDVEPKDVTAKFEDGILKLTLPKKERKELPPNGSIRIE